jgi:hypothetical protein
MRFQLKLLLAVSAIALVFLFTTASGRSAERARFFDSGQPRELINQPVCWPPEQPDDPRYCDFAHRT